MHTLVPRTGCAGRIVIGGHRGRAGTRRVFKPWQVPYLPSPKGAILSRRRGRPAAT